MSIWTDNAELEAQKNPPPKKPSAWRRFIDAITYRKERNALRAELNAVEDRLRAIEAILADDKAEAAKPAPGRPNDFSRELL